MTQPITDVYSQYNKRLYSSPFFDLSNFYMPKNFKQFFKWCKYYFLTNGLIYPVIMQMSRYPITSLTYSTDDSPTRRAYKIIFEDILNIESTLKELGVDYFTYGNSFAALSIPFKRILICPKCKSRYDIKNVEYKYDYSKVNFSGKCQKCKLNVKYIPYDEVQRLPKKLRIIRYDPENIYIKHNSINGDIEYRYKVPASEVNSIKKCDRFYIDNTPMRYLESVAKGRRIIFRNDKIFHMKRANLSGANMEWGMPLILPALKKAFYLQILQKAQEAIAIQHIIPLIVLFPQPNAGESPYDHGVVNWKNNMEKELEAWKKDPNRVPIMPFPVGVNQVFGEGRRFLVTPEIREASQQVVSSMGVPQEFVFGGLSWSAASINLRMLENQFLNYRNLLVRFCNFIKNQIVQIMNLPKIQIGMRDFKMMDDVAQKNLLFQLNQADKISDETLLDSLGMDQKRQLELLEKEFKEKIKFQSEKMIEQEKLNGELMAIRNKFAIESQMEANEKMQDGAGAAPGLDMIGHYNSELQSMAPKDRERIMMQMQQQMPNMAGMINERNSNGGGGTSPTQRPPRGSNRQI